MNINTEIIFSDKTVTYDQFVTDLATRIALKIHQVEKGQLEISQAKAFKMFGITGRKGHVGGLVSLA